MVTNFPVFSNQKFDIQTDRNQGYLLDIAHKKYYLIPIDSELLKDIEKQMGTLPDKKNPIACEGSLLCYQCCTADVSVSKEFCEHFQIQNWGRGKECGC